MGQVNLFFKNNNSPIGEVKEQPTFSDIAEQIIWTLSPILVTIVSSLTTTCSDWERSGKVDTKHNKAPIISILESDLCQQIVRKFKYSYIRFP